MFFARRIHVDVIGWENPRIGKMVGRESQGVERAEGGGVVGTDEYGNRRRRLDADGRPRGAAAVFLQAEGPVALLYIFTFPTSEQERECDMIAATPRIE
jgi:hypothetical protein